MTGKNCVRCNGEFVGGKWDILCDACMRELGFASDDSDDFAIENAAERAAERAAGIA